MRPRIVALLCGAALALAGCAEQSPSQVATTPTPKAADEAALQITTVPVSSRPTKRLLKFVGTLFGNEEVVLSSQVEGQVTALHADLGDQVEADAVLLDIDDSSLRAQ